MIPTKSEKPLPDTITNLRRFEAALRGESRESVSGPLADEFGDRALVVLRFIRAATRIVAPENLRRQEWALRFVFLVGFGISTVIDLAAFVLWRVL